MARHLSATRGPYVTGGTAPHSGQIDTVTPASSAPTVLYQQALSLSFNLNSIHIRLNGVYSLIGLVHA
jgi:hypothetical protein